MLLQHIHYTSSIPILYTHALHIQEIFARQFLTHKASPSHTAPTPKLLTFSTTPTYTTGLRDSRTLSSAQISHLTATGARHHSSPRGGLTTYHGPGQLTAFLITDLKGHGLSARCFVHAWEDAVIAAAGVYGVEATRWSPGMKSGALDETRPGVWTSGTDKLCSIGIHFRRGVSSFGVGFNVTDEVQPWFGRIVACGIPEAKAVSLAGEQARCATGEMREVSVDGVAVTLAEVVAKGLDGVEGVESVDSRALGEI